jgi:Putative prokaryotic signal transducing protein
MSEQPEEVVQVAVVTDEIEAEEACGLLRTEGIKCGHAPTEQGESLSGLTSDWTSQAIFVAPADAERARELLGESAEAPS